MTSSGEAALAYHEPSIVVILVQSSFLLFLNVLNWALDSLLYCGLIGQILVGIAWGTPGAQILSIEAEHAVVQLGYLGLILLVFEAGLLINFQSLKANIALSIVVAITGICAPIALSFTLAPLLGASNLQCFAAGAALCSTSLGTTFAVLRASGLTSTRLGVVLTSAAMLDDVVGLVMVQVISNLGGVGTSVSAVTVVRPVLVSVAFVVVAVVLCRFLVRPVTVVLNNWRMTHGGWGLDGLLRRRETALTLHTALLIALVAGSSYAGTSNLFASYIAGAVISWWDSEVPHPEYPPTQSGGVGGKRAAQTNPVARHPNEDGTTPAPTSVSDHIPKTTASPSTLGSDIFEHYYHPAVKWVLQPFFFASIGFSIPITSMFSGPTVWKGVVYAALMVIAKLFCGLWLVRFPSAIASSKSKIKSHAIDGSKSSHASSTPGQGPGPAISGSGSEFSRTRPGAPPPNVATNAETIVDEIAQPTGAPTATSAETPSSRKEARNTAPNPPKPRSLYPASILGLAMVPRGEIGFLISARVGDLLVATWAIVLCTIVGPVCVGLMVRRVKNLENKAVWSARSGGDASWRDVLGVWGVQ
ncbi:Sodium/hydrogen exchanger family-domain-containing protein [Phialemonium atrogriseum]|uniref:Sodium/hydrogen exchanger family-domain-containing protein n=1 Tax=Phialemonium atrogriseum TaxID=1093897 RepID=A0AAJ0BTK1_9PEZI|nr:Sodium/hydrogen exchanger family-domain-containing protein [Phialemonium atrogriseum]KAK1763966.1 Sodium/hydrogen exchanger family-domain-containing protein [Phialemonium atrogriseum]